MIHRLVLINPNLDNEGVMMAPVVVGHDSTYLRALAKSDEQARTGNLPRLVERTGSGLTRTFAVGSRGSANLYLVSISSPSHEEDYYAGCECAAGKVPRLCWHVVHVVRALDGTIGSFALPELATPRTGKDS
jgi:hypothetical protein